MPTKRKKATKRTVKKTSEKTASSVLKDMPFDFDCGVAVWQTGLRTMSNEVVGFLDYHAKHHESVSKCRKYRLKTEQIGAIYLFKSKKRALEYYGFLCNAKSPHGDYRFVVEHLGTYLKIAAEIEDNIPDVHKKQETKIIIRNLETSPEVKVRVLDSCNVFGNYLDYEEYADVGEQFAFRHLVVTYKFAVQATAAKLGLDGKWIEEQVYPLSVVVDPDVKVKFINMELSKKNKILFQF